MATVSDIDNKLDDLSTTVDQFIATNSGGGNDGGGPTPVATQADLDRFDGKIDAIKAKLVVPASGQ